MSSYIRQILALCIVALVATGPLVAQSPDMNIDPFAIDSETNPKVDKLEQYLHEAQSFFLLQRPIDARAKLQQALQVAPNDYRPHLLLGAYYLGEVAHFQLAYKYLLNSEKLFQEKYGRDDDGTLDRAQWRQHAKLLYLIAETRLNLDDYQGALDTLDRFQKNYWDTWYPGTRAWVLMKLKRLDEAITVAQNGLLQQADPGKTYNILGILFSVKGNSALALNAFARSIRSEVALGGSGQIATPLNNSGEVYREMFQDPKAEAAWLRAISLPDGCEHILPALNLSILLVDELRLFQAERVLSDFEACFANDTVRQDTEHRALIRLGRGKIQLRKGEIDKSMANLKMASERQQWFGKIGTDENDMRLGALVANAQALQAYAAVLRDRQSATLTDSLKQRAMIPLLQTRAWWLNRQARQLSLEKLADFEDLHIRHTDAMVEYPTLASLMIGYPTASLSARIQRITQDDDRVRSHDYYRLFLGTHLIHSGQAEQGLALVHKALSGFRKMDRLARAEAIAQIIIANEKLSWWWNRNEEYFNKQRELIFQLYELLPSHVRYLDQALSVRFALAADSPIGKRLVKQLKQRLLHRRFADCDTEACSKAPYTLHISEAEAVDSASKSTSISLELRSADGKRLLAQEKERLSSDAEEQVKLVNGFIDKVFSHRSDPPNRELPELEVLEGIF